MQWLAVAVGGALGSLARFAAARGAYQLLGTAFPWGTLAVNVAGALAIGFSYVWLVERDAHGPDWRAFIMVGVLGGFTTFSSFSLETLLLVQQGAALRAAVNVGTSVMVCLLATAFGIWVGRVL